jgi:exopolysaccharide biosynthesis polyprenyl glycosylphosphotransferase
MATSQFLKRFAPSTAGNVSGESIPMPEGYQAAAVKKNVLAAALWMLGDVIIVVAALVISIRGWLGRGFFRPDSPYHTNAMFHASVGWQAGALFWFIFSLILVSRRYHLYGPTQMRSALHEQRLTVQACLTAGLLLAGALYLIKGEVVSRGVVVVTVAITAVLLCVRRLAWRYMMHRRFERGMETRNIIIVGTGRVGHTLRHHLESVRHLGYRFKGFVTIPGIDAGISPIVDSEILGSIDDVLDIARKHFADEIFLSVTCEPELVKSIVGSAREAGVDIRVIPELYDGLAWNSPVEYVGQFPTIPLHRSNTPVLSFFFKRLLDITLSSLAILLLMPVACAIIVAIRLDSSGPVYYCSDRIGKKGRIFRCIKFRTMVADAERRRAEILHMNERDGVLFKVSNDPRVTGVGRYLRKYSLDELPQFFNVLLGDMSLVGPRPPLAGEVKRYDLSHLRRLDVMPGMTGLWQVEARQDPSFASYISMDTAYIENWSLWLDIKILVRTLSVVCAGTGS